MYIARRKFILKNKTKQPNKNNTADKRIFLRYYYHD